MTTQVDNSGDRAFLTLMVESLGILYDQHIMVGSSKLNPLANYAVEDTLAKVTPEPSSVVGDTILYSKPWAVIYSSGSFNLHSGRYHYSDPMGGPGHILPVTQSEVQRMDPTGIVTTGATFAGVTPASPISICNPAYHSPVAGITTGLIWNTYYAVGVGATGPSISVSAAGVTPTAVWGNANVAAAATGLTLGSMAKGQVVFALNEVSEGTLRVVAGESEGDEPNIAPIDIDPAVLPHVRNHDPVLIELCLVANQASVRTGVPLSSVKIYLDDCYEEDSRDTDAVVVVEAEVRASIESRQEYWRVAEQYLATAVEKLPKTEKAFFLETVSFEVSSPSFET